MDLKQLDAGISANSTCAEVLSAIATTKSTDLHIAEVKNINLCIIGRWLYPLQGNEGEVSDYLTVVRLHRLCHDHAMRILTGFVQPPVTTILFEGKPIPPPPTLASSSVDLVKALTDWKAKLTT